MVTYYIELKWKILLFKNWLYKKLFNCKYNVALVLVFITYIAYLSFSMMGKTIIQKVIFISDKSEQTYSNKITNSIVLRIKNISNVLSPDYDVLMQESGPGPFSYYKGEKIPLVVEINDIPEPIEFSSIEVGPISFSLDRFMANITPKINVNEVRISIEDYESEITAYIEVDGDMMQVFKSVHTKIDNNMMDEIALRIVSATQKKRVKLNWKTLQYIYEGRKSHLQFLKYKNEIDYMKAEVNYSLGVNQEKQWFYPLFLRGLIKYHKVKIDKHANSYYSKKSLLYDAINDYANGVSLTDKKLPLYYGILNIRTLLMNEYQESCLEDIDRLSESINQLTLLYKSNLSADYLDNDSKNYILLVIGLAEYSLGMAYEKFIKNNQIDGCKSKINKFQAKEMAFKHYIKANCVYEVIETNDQYTDVINYRNGLAYGAIGELLFIDGDLEKASSNIQKSICLKRKLIGKTNGPKWLLGTIASDHLKLSKINSSLGGESEVDTNLAIQLLTNLTRQNDVSINYWAHSKLADAFFLKSNILQASEQLRKLLMLVAFDNSIEYYDDGASGIDKGYFPLENNNLLIGKQILEKYMHNNKSDHDGLLVMLFLMDINYRLDTYSEEAYTKLLNRAQNKLLEKTNEMEWMIRIAELKYQIKKNKLTSIPEDLMGIIKSDSSKLSITVLYELIQFKDFIEDHELIKILKKLTSSNKEFNNISDIDLNIGYASCQKVTSLQSNIIRSAEQCL